MYSRRSFLAGSLKTGAGLLLARSRLARADAGVAVGLRLGSAAPTMVPANFTGLGYEMSSVATPGLLNASNERYMRLVRRLGVEGVLRAGGIVADYTKYEANGVAKADRQNTVITRAGLEQLGAFLERISWSAIWSLNFAQGSLSDAVAEAKAVSAVLGRRLLAIELGNEVENYGKGERPFRQPPYGYEAYRKEFEEWRAAIVSAVPGMRFAAPDTAASIDWVERMAADGEKAVQLLTTHYYFGGQSRGRAEDLLHPDPRLMEVLSRLRVASEKSGIPWRMCETNSFFGGGKRGVSDTIVGALWTLDYMLLLAGHGCSGVNIETGVNQLGFISPYSPIQDDGAGRNTAGAPYYGMLAFAEATRDCHASLPVEVVDGPDSLTAYAFENVGEVNCVAIVNRGLNEVRVSFGGLRIPGKLRAMRLLAPRGESERDVTFAGAAVDDEANWTPQPADKIWGPEVMVPGMSAVVMKR